MPRITKKNNKKNVLPNNYIPILTKKVQTSVLGHLPKSSLVQLILLWTKLVNTQPQKQSKSISQKQVNSHVSKTVQDMKLNPGKWPKRKVIDRILFEFWPQGLNLLQLSQIDSQMIVDRPASYSWILSTVRDSANKEVAILLDPQKFLNTLSKDLSVLFMTYIYVCKHPKLPIILIRIQVFDLLPMSQPEFSNRPHISSHKAIFLAIPLNSPHVIHSPGNGMAYDIVLQAVERSLPQNPSSLLRLITTEEQRPIKSLESMHILKGSSRFGNSLGVWAPYADGAVDMLPLNTVDNHAVFQSTKDSDSEAEVDITPEERLQSSQMKKLKNLANIRFKGSKTGKVLSEKFFDDNRQLATQKKNNVLRDDDEDETKLQSEFSSIVPIQYAEYVLRDKLGHEDYTDIKIKLTGLDVFAGLHELSILTTNKQEAAVDLEKIPGWLTGEEGQSCGMVKDGNFVPYTN